MGIEKRLIRADVTVEAFTEWLTSRYDGRMPADIVNEIPTVDAVEVVHGCWVDKHYKVACSVCENAVFLGTSDPLIHKEEKKNLKYCPNCGARMDGGSHGL